MKSEILDLSHKELLSSRLRGITIPIAEYAFPNLYLFRAAHRYEVISDREIFVSGISYDGFRYLMPTFDIRNVDIGYLAGLMEGYDFLFPVPEEWLGVFDEEEFSVSWKDGDTDYLYTVEKMSSFKGRRLHKKRNLLKQFTSRYEHRAAPLTVELIEDAVSVLTEWQRQSGSSAPETDFAACREALALYEELILCGGIYYADGTPAGFVVGEELNDETFALHFAKARKEFTGIYQYMFNNFARILPDRYRLMNFEQDLDREPLRLAKSSYLPDIMLKKYRVSLK